MSKSNYHPKIHHRKSIRLKGYDYSQPGCYFVTICSFEKDHLFWEIDAGIMHLNQFGQIVHEEWLKSEQIRKEIKLDEFVVMPNHFHGIVWITNPNYKVGAQGIAPPHAPPQTPNKLYRKPKSLGSFIGAFKAVCKTRINTIRNTPRSTCLATQLLRSYYP